MVEAGFLSPEQARIASQQPLRLSAKGDDTGYPYPVDWVAELLPEFVGEQDGDLIVETTIDAGLQRVSQQALRHLLDEEGGEVERRRRRRGGARSAGRGQGAGRRPLLLDEPVRPRAEIAAPAGLGLQALRLSRRARERLYAGFGRL